MKNSNPFKIVNLEYTILKILEFPSLEILSKVASLLI